MPALLRLIVVRLLGILIRRLARLLRVAPIDLAIAALREVVRLGRAGHETDAWHLDFGKRRGDRPPNEAPDA